jgi:hypothetical protein
MCGPLLDYITRASSSNHVDTLDERPGIFIKDNPIFSSERMLHENYGSKGSDAKKKKKIWS